MIMIKKILSLILSVLLIICCITGCGEGYEEAYIYFELLDVPKTLDPQTASSDSELLIVRNTYEGLLRTDADGKIVNGAAESYTYSNLSYTFKLKKNLTWSDGTPLTADDFVFGLRRAVDPKISAPFASRLKSIIGAENIINSSADVTSLGVKATDKHTLKITLCRDDPNFLQTLTTSVCMPCNEEFFENSIGKYGLDSENIICNGSYRLTKWSKEDFGIRLYKNEEYGGNFEPQNAAVFISCVDDENQISRLKDGDSDMAFLPCNELEKVNDNIKTVGINNICWVMTIKADYSPEVRKAFATAFSNKIYEASLPSGFKSARSIYPDVLSINTEGIGLMSYNLEAAKQTMSAQIADMTDKKFPEATMYYYKTDGVSNIATAIVGHWQQNLSTFINIKEADNLLALKNEINESTLDFALFPITVKSDSFSEYAVNFASVSTADVPDTLQQELFKNHTILPVAYQSTNISYISTLENVEMSNDNGYIDFSFIIKK